MPTPSDQYSDEPSFHGPTLEDEYWGQRFSAVMLGVSAVIIVLLLVLGSLQ
jgi:hypothetical protein